MLFSRNPKVVQAADEGESSCGKRWSFCMRCMLEDLYIWRLRGGGTGAVILSVLARISKPKRLSFHNKREILKGTLAQQ